jgi:hypothetical protein
MSLKCSSFSRVTGGTETEHAATLLLAIDSSCHSYSLLCYSVRATLLAGLAHDVGNGQFDLTCGIGHLVSLRAEHTQCHARLHCAEYGEFAAVLLLTLEHADPAGEHAADMDLGVQHLHGGGFG